MNRTVVRSASLARKVAHCSRTKTVARVPCVRQAVGCKIPEKDWSPPGNSMPSGEGIDDLYDLATHASVPTFNVWFSFDKRITKDVGEGWDGPLLGNSSARWTFIGSPIWFERGQVLKFYDPVHCIGAAKKFATNRRPICGLLDPRSRERFEGHPPGVKQG